MTQLIEIKDAIEISRIIAKAPEERLPMIMSVLESADLTVEGLEELEAWAVSKNTKSLIDIEDFMKALQERFADQLQDDGYWILSADFIKFCKEQDMDARATRVWLARKGIIQSKDQGGKKEFTIVKRSGDSKKPQRYVHVLKDWQQGHEEGDAT